MKNPRTEVTLGLMFTIAAPMVVSQASETLMLFFNRWVVSFLGADFIPASMSGGLSSFVFTSFFTGITGYVNALVAQYHGAQREDRCIHVASQGIWLTVCFYPLLLLLIPVGHQLFILAGHSPRQVALEFSYYRILMYGSVIFMLQSVLVGYFVGHGKTRVVMTANLLGILVNLPLNWCLVFGKLGFPALGIEGAALGTLGGSLFIVAILFVSYLHSAGYRERAGRAAWALRGELMGKLLRYGLPAGAEMFINIFAFNAFVQLMQSYSEHVATAVTITFNYDLVSFIPMLGVGAATTALVGHRMGAGDPVGARKVAFLGLRLALGYGALMGVVFVVGAPILVRFFAGGFTPGDQASILPIAQTLLRMAALYTLADAANVVFSGALRGAGDTRWVMVVSGILHWIMAVGAFVFIRILVLPPALVWLFFILFVFSMCFTMFFRHRRGKWENIRLVESAAAPA